MIEVIRFFGCDYKENAPNPNQMAREPALCRPFAYLNGGSEPVHLTRSELINDPDDPILFGDKTVRHLKIEADVRESIDVDGQPLFNEFEGSGHADDGWLITYKWWQDGDYFYYGNASHYPWYIQGGNGGAWAIKVDVRTMLYCTRSWSSNIPAGELVANRDRALEQVSADTPWQQMQQYGTWWMGMYYKRVNAHNKPGSLPSGSLRDLFNSYYPDRNPVQGIKTRLFTDALSQLNVSDNNISNIREMIKLVSDIRSGNIRSLATSWYDWLNGDRSLKQTGKAITSGWLMYRYLYNTTKADADQAVDAALNGYLGTIKEQTIKHPLRSSFETEDAVYRLKLRVADNKRDVLLSAVNQIRRYGLLPDAHVLWDSLPFSFIVDWAIPVDDGLQSFEELLYADAYDILEALLSCKRSKVIDIAGMSVTFTEYYRVFETSLPEWQWVEDTSGTPVSRTLRRTADGWSLFVQLFT